MEDDTRVSKTRPSPLGKGGEKRYLIQEGADKSQEAIPKPSGENGRKRYFFHDIENPDPSFFNEKMTFELPAINAVATNKGKVTPSASHPDRYDAPIWRPEGIPGEEDLVTFVEDTEHEARFVVSYAPRLVRSGATANVLPAWDRHTGRFVALKMTQIETLDEKQHYDSYMEAQTQAHVTTPLALPIYDFFVVKTDALKQHDIKPNLRSKKDGNEYAVTVLPLYAQSDSLTSKIRDDALSVADIKIVARELSEAIDTLANQQVEKTDGLNTGEKVMVPQPIFHRDIKPRNLFFVDGHIRIVDFGSANTVAYNGEQQSVTPQYASHERMTSKEDITGMSVESELQSVTIILFEALTGKILAKVLQEEQGGDDDPYGHMIRFDNINGVTEKMKETIINGLRGKNIPTTQDEKVLQFFEKMFKKDPQERFHTGKEFSQAFDSAIGEPVMIPPLPQIERFAPYNSIQEPDTLPSRKDDFADITLNNIKNDHTDQTKPHMEATQPSKKRWWNRIRQ